MGTRPHPRGTSRLPAPGQASPQTLRWLYGGYAVLTLAALVLSWHRSPGALFGVGAIIIAFATIVSLLTFAVSRRQTLPAMVCLWAVLVLCIASATLFLSGLFFGQPERAAKVIARLLDDPSIVIYRGHGQLIEFGPGTTTLSEAFRGTPSGSDDKIDRAAALSKAPSATVKGTTIKINSPALYFNVLRIEDATLDTEGREVTIQAIRIETVGNAEIKATISPGSTGQAGKDVGSVRLVIFDELSGRLNVNLDGPDGGKGLDGKPGPKGANGGQGENSSQGFLTCNHGGGKGGTGLRGGNGEDGKPGAKGGAGGDLIVEAPRPDRVSQLIAFSAKGGAGGAGGTGGAAGAGGDGGPGGGGGGLCGGGPAGDPGPPGAPGANAGAGPSGSDGKFTALKL